MKIHRWPWSLRGVIKGQHDREAARARLHLLKSLVHSSDNWAVCRDALHAANMGVMAKGHNDRTWIYVLPTLKVAFKVESDAMTWIKHRQLGTAKK
jgi:hypothetical protein